MELISCSCIGAVVSVIIIISAILVSPIILIGLIWSALFVLIPLLPFTKKSFLQHMPNRIVFDFDKDTIFYSVARYKSMKNAQNAQQKVNIIGDINSNSFLK